jgi:hypothetical protein
MYRNVEVLMTNKKLKEKKKKKREDRAKATVLVKRKALRAKIKHDKEVARIDRQYNKKLVPYVRPEKAAQMRFESDNKIKQQIEHNLEILKALEAEYLKEQKEKAERNANLEAEGHTTLKEKMDVMNNTAQDKHEKS